MNEPNKKKKSLSPILDQIVHGGSAVALNLIKLTALARDKHMFRQPSLNKTIIFKYPNFELQIADQAPAPAAPAKPGAPAKPAAPAPAPAAEPPKSERPIETAIYVPHDATEIPAGGYGIYLRQRDFVNLLKHHTGVDFEEGNKEFERDIDILRTIDTIPSLDPFLLKSALQKYLNDIHPAYFAISQAEEDGIKSLIAEKVNPIVARALGLKSAADVNERSQRFLQALWDPTMPEAKLFVSAFGISGDQAQQIFEGWKGITFYEHTFTNNLQHVAGVLRWLTGPDSMPLDAREFKHLKEQQDMFRQAVVKKLRNLISNVNGIFGEYTECHGKFLNGGDPKPFRNFLAGVYRRYWVLGYCSMAVLHTVNIHERYMASAIKNRLQFEQIEEMLKRMDASLSSQANAQNI